MLIILLVAIEIPTFTSFKNIGDKMEKLNDNNDDDSSSEYFKSGSEDSNDLYESNDSIDLVKELRQENYIWTAINEYPLSNDPTKDIEEKRLKSYMSLTPYQKSHITPINIQDGSSIEEDQEKSSADKCYDNIQEDRGDTQEDRDDI